MDVLSNISQPTPISPYFQDTCTGVGGGYAPNQQHPCNSSPLNNNPAGFTLLQGHIKLMAMVPHLPENHLSEKILRPSMQPAPSKLPSTPDCRAYPCTSSHSLPPITPRMMPSTISQKYQQYLHNNQTFWNGSHARTFPHQNGYPEQFPYSTGGAGPWYPPNFAQESQVYPRRQIAMMPSFESTAHENDYGMKPFMDTPTYLDSSCSNNPYQHPWLPPHLAYQQMMAAHSRSHFMQHLNNHQYPHPFPQNSPYSNEAFPPPFSHHPHQQSHYSPYAAQSLPDFFTAAPMSTFGMPPFPCQSCCSLPIVSPSPTSGERTGTKSLKKHRKSPGTSSEDVFVVVEESEDTTSSSSSTSLSLKEEPEIVPKTVSKPTVVFPQLEETSKSGGITPSKSGIHLDENENKSNDQILPSTAKGKQKSPVLVTVHECFPSDSSEAEIDPDAASDIEKGPHFRKKKLPIVKTIRKAAGTGNGNIHISGNGQVFEDLDNDLSPDEVRTYTCEYLVQLLTSQDWNNCYIALQIMVRFARHRPQVLLNYLTANGVILWYTYNHITSPKSALCRAAIVTFKELFVRIPTSLDNQIDKITEKLVMKSLAPNKFIRKECDDALMAMVENCNLAKILSALEHIRKKQHTRAKGLKVTLARMALQILLTAGVDNCLMNQPYAEKLLPMLFCFMMEPNIEIRSFAKQALSMLMNHLQFEAAVMRHVSFDRNSTEVFKKLDKMRGRNRKLK